MENQSTPQGQQGKPSTKAPVDTALSEKAEGEFPGLMNEPKIFMGKEKVKTKGPVVADIEVDVTLTLDEWNDYWNTLSREEQKEYIELFKQLGLLGDKPDFMQVQRAWRGFGEIASEAYNNGAGVTIEGKENTLLEPLEFLAYSTTVASELFGAPQDDEKLIKDLTPEAELQSFQNASETAIRRLALRNGIELGEDYIKALVNSVVEGKDTIENVELSLRQNYIANAFPVFSEQIIQGRDVYDLASPYIAKMASLLELNQFDIDLDNPIIQRAIQAVDTSGKPTLKPLWMFEQELKELPEYEFTNRGQQEATDLGMKLLKGFGLA
jgi:hypothetical protein